MPEPQTSPTDTAEAVGGASSGPAATEPCARRRPTTLTWLVCGGVVVLTALVFLPTLANDFVRWDDHRVLVHNPHFRGFSPDNLIWMFTTQHMCHYQPLTWLTYALDHALWGMNPRGYHLTSVLWHAATAAAFFWVLRSLLRWALTGWQGPSTPMLDVAAAVGALLFAIHPLRVESVAWATERRDLVSGLFLMLSVAAYLRAHDHGTNRRGPWIAASCLAYACSLLGKAIGMTLPVVLLLLDVYPLRRIGPWRRVTGDRGPLAVVLEKAPYVVLAVAAAGVAWLGQYRDAPMASVEGVPLIARLAIASFGAAFYVRKTFLPVELSPLVAPAMPFDPLAPVFVASAATVVMVTAVLALFARRWPAGLIAWGIYLVLLAPVIGLVQVGPQIAADRYSYLSCTVLPALVVGGWAFLWMRRERGASWRTGHLVVTVVLAVAVPVLAWLTVRQAAVWRDTESLWQQAIHVQPDNAVAHANLASWYAHVDRFDRSVEHYRRASELRPGHAPTLLSLATSLERLHRFDEAASIYLELLEGDPSCFGAHRGLGLLLIRSKDQGHVRQGERHLRRALEIRPAATEVRHHLAMHFRRTRQWRQAVELLGQGVSVRPNDVACLAMLAWLRATCPDAALRDGERAVDLATRAIESVGRADADLLDVLAAAYAEHGRFDRAVETAGQAVTLARGAGRTSLLPALERRLAAYRSRRAWREGATQ